MKNKINIGTEIDLPELLQTRMLIQANSGGGKSVTARIIMEQVAGLVPFIVLDVDGEYYTLKEHYGDILVIGGQFADIPISMKSVKLLPREIIGNRLSVIIDLSDLKMHDRILYVKYFLESMMDLGKEYWVQYLVFLEEAHKLCGEQDKQESATAVKDLMSRGRKRGYCGILVTQRISKLHKDAAAECNNKFIGRTILDIDMDRSAKELGFSNTRDRLKLRDLEPGHFYAFGTAINPHYVHEVTINLPKTKIPKAGTTLDIKPKKPTEKIVSVLTKLNDLPAEAEKEVKTLAQLQQEVNRLRTELTKANQTRPAADPQEIKSLKQEIEQWKQAISIYEERHTDLSIILQEAAEGLTDSWKAPGRKIGTKTLKSGITIIPEKGQESSKKGQFISKNNQTIPEKGKNVPIPYNPMPKRLTSPNSGSLGKCPMAILQFLASFPDRGWTKAQIGIATNYSPGSGGFNNALAELNSKGLILRGERIRINPDADIRTNLGDFEPQQYSIETFKSKLGKCEREIYVVLLSHPHDIFNKESLAAETESNYSPNSGGFNNALSTLNTLELIRRENGRIKLNPELLEL